MISTGTAIAPERKTGDDPIRAITLDVQKMTPEAFAPYGQIINARGEVELDMDGGKASFAAQTVEARPLLFSFLGRHERTEQVFIPMGGTRSDYCGRAAVRERFGRAERRKNGCFSG